MSDSDRSEHWIDHLLEKHECFTYRETRVESIMAGERRIALIVPSWVPRFELLRASFDNNLLFLLLKDLETTGWDQPLGISAIAKETAPDNFTTLFWHATYPYLLDKLDAGDAPRPG
jgi:hypothetical protein